MKTTGKTRKYIYGITLFFITLSGFAQMPIFKRYYIADIPGFGWLAQFYVTHIIHYIAAIVLIAFVIYILFDFIFRGARFNSVTGPGYFKIAILAGLIVTGSLMVVKNLPNIYFGHTAVIVLDLTHLGFCMILLCVSLYSVIRKKRWVS
jgi:ABC-type glucose/galactose transport system permease subunit